MRLQLCHRGVRVLDDAYNANADSMLAALQTLREMPCAGRRVAVLGDMAELGESAGSAHRDRPPGGCRRGGSFSRWVSGPRPLPRRREKSGLKNVAAFAEVEAAAQAVKGFARPGDLVLIKASRAMRLERITEILKNGSSAKSPDRTG